MQNRPVQAQPQAVIFSTACVHIGVRHSGQIICIGFFSNLLSPQSPSLILSCSSTPKMGILNSKKLELCRILTLADGCKGGSVRIWCVIIFGERSRICHIIYLITFRYRFLFQNNSIQTRKNLGNIYIDLYSCPFLSGVIGFNF